MLQQHRETDHFWITYSSQQDHHRHIYIHTRFHIQEFMQSSIIWSGPNILSEWRNELAVDIAGSHAGVAVLAVQSRKWPTEFRWKTFARSEHISAWTWQCEKWKTSSRRSAAVETELIRNARVRRSTRVLCSNKKLRPRETNSSSRIGEPVPKTGKAKYSWKCQRSRILSG